MNSIEEEQEEEDRILEAVVKTVVAQNQLVISYLKQKQETEKKKKPDHRLLPRGQKTKWKHLEALHCIKRDYLGSTSIPDSPLFRGAAFVMMFRLSKARVELLFQDIMAADIPFYKDKTDAAGRKGASLEAKVLLPLKTLAYGVAPHAFTDYFQMSVSLARKCCMEFDAAIMKIYQEEFLRLPTKEDMKSIVDLHREQHGVDGMFGSIDCMHTRWKNCPKGWAGQYSGKEGDPTIVLEAIADYHLWFWHGSYGYAGTLNDLNVLNLSPFLDALTSGKFAEVEADVVPYKIGDEKFNKLFVLADGIYPDYSRFVKSMKEPVTEEEKLMTLWQESKRKDVERAFGILQIKWQWIARPILLLELGDISKRVGTCMILHNMCVCDRVMGEVGVRYRPSAAVIDVQEDDIPQSQEALDKQGPSTRYKGSSGVGLSNMSAREQQLITNRQAWRELNNGEECQRLHDAIMKYLLTNKKELAAKAKELKKKRKRSNNDLE